MCKVLKAATRCERAASLGYPSVSKPHSLRRAKSVSSTPTQSENVYYPNLAEIVQNGVRTVALSNIEIPQEIKDISGCTDAEKAANKLESLVIEVEANTLDEESKYSPFAEDFHKVTKWASGGRDVTTFGSNKFYRFNNTDHSDFFEGLFKVVAKEIGATCCRNNLFHGHAVFAPNHKDLRVVFHAFEYPSNVHELGEFPQEAKIVENDVDSFNTGIAGFSKRNVFWSLKSHHLVIPDYSKLETNSPYRKWLEELALSCGVCTVDQGTIGKDLVCLNYFPKEFEKGRAVFLKT